MNRIHTQSDWIARAQAVLPAGGFGNFDPGIIIARGQGARVWDEDGTEYVDYLIGAGPMLLGHGHPEVLEAVFEQLASGMTFFAGNSRAIELAEAIIRAVPCAGQVRFVSSGGEADMYAMRLARAFTGRDKIIKCEGGYHGMSAEALMSLAPSRRVNFPHAVPDSAGIPRAVAGDMLIAPFNDIACMRGLLDAHDGQVAAIIVEPLQRVIPPEPGYLAALREECSRRGVLLIFDEIVTGFRLAYGGAQEAYGVIPDIASLGKIVGGGFPLAAIVASAGIMARFDCAKVGAEGWLMQYGTLSGNPVAAAAGLKTLEVLAREGMYETLRANGARLMAMQSEALSAAGVPHRVVGDPALFDVLFLDKEVRNYRDTQDADATRGGLYNRVLREHGVLKSPGKLYPSLALTEADFEVTQEAVHAAVAAIAD